MNIALEIKAEAIRQNIELRDLAKAINTYPGRLSRAISEDRPLSTDLAIKAAEKLGVPLSELVKRAEENQKPSQVA